MDQNGATYYLAGGRGRLLGSLESLGDLLLQTTLLDFKLSMNLTFCLRFVLRMYRRIWVPLEVMSAIVELCMVPIRRVFPMGYQHGL
jgi:hypothetical protein